MWAHLTVRPGISMCCRGGKSKRRGGRAMPDRQRSVQVGFAIRSSRPAAGWRLNGHFGPVPPRDSISTVILAPSRHGTASQRPFGSCPAAGWRLNRHFGPVPPRDGVSTVILAPSRHGTPRRTSQSMSSGPPSGEISSIIHTFPPEVARASIFACA